MAKLPSWPDKIKAPAEALKMYRCMARLQHTSDFAKCHVYTGASINGIPHISWKDKSTNLPKTICAFMGLEYKKKTCRTPNCMNPFHYVEIGKVEDTAIPTAKLLEPAPPPPSPNLDEYVELIEYYIDEEDLKDPTFEQLRAIIPTEDISDDLLTKAFHEYQQKHL